MYSNVIATDTSSKIIKNINDTFVSEDETNCPCISYNIDKVMDARFGLDLAKDEYYGFQFSVDNQGNFTMQNYTSYHKFMIWLSCKNPAGTDTGLR